MCLLLRMSTPAQFMWSEKWKTEPRHLSYRHEKDKIEVCNQSCFRLALFSHFYHRRNWCTILYIQIMAWIGLRKSFHKYFMIPEIEITQNSLHRESLQLTSQRCPFLTWWYRTNTQTCFCIPASTPSLSVTTRLQLTLDSCSEQVPPLAPSPQPTLRIVSHSSTIDLPDLLFLTPFKNSRVSASSYNFLWFFSFDRPEHDFQVNYRTPKSLHESLRLPISAGEQYLWIGLWAFHMI